MEDSSGLHCLERVLDNVVERLFHLIAIDLYSWQSGSQIGFEQDIAILDFPSQEGYRFFDDFIQII